MHVRTDISKKYKTNSFNEKKTNKEKRETNYIYIMNRRVYYLLNGIKIIVLCICVVEIEESEKGELNP
jgi:hypothetical protein